MKGAGLIRFLVAALLVIGVPQPALAASAPTGVSIAAPVDPVALGTTVSATGAFTDPDSTTHSATWTWGDGSSSAGQVTHAGDGGTVTGAHGYAQAGVYRVGLDVRDESGATGTAVFEYVVVFDASGGFVTGGGWIDSPPGAYPTDPSLVGRANFGLVAKYKPGASEPDGTTEFQFHAAGLNFHSADYEWLVVSGARAQYKGTGTIQGLSGLFRFIVTAIDGDLLGKGQPDRFRIKILGDSAVVYDNQMGSGDNADPSMVLGGGSIVIHKGKGGPQPVNHAPVANAGADVSVTTGQLVTLDGSGSSDPDGDTLTYAWTIVAAPAGSTAALVGATTVAPTLTPDRAGAYRIELVVSDGVLFSAPDEVQVNASAPANRAPVAADDQYAATEDTLRTVAAPGVLGNDTDADGDTLSAQLVSGPSHGTLVLSGNGSFTYTPSLNFNGPDSFTYRASDGTATSGVATVSITVGPVNDAPDAVDDTASTNENTPVTIDILANDSDVDSQVSTLAVSITVAPAHGVAGFDAVTRRATYTPAQDFSGSDSFTYRICDAEPACDSANVQVTVSDTEHPPVAADDQYAATEDTLRTVAAPGVLGNDTDADGDALSAQLVSGPAHGTLTLSSDGSFTYMPNANFNGADGFSYRASDGTLFSAPATVHIDVAPVNDPPDAQDDSATTAEDTAVQIDVLANDSDVDGTLDPASVAVLGVPALGSATVDHTSGKITYTPGADLHGSDSFTYRVCDNAAACDTALVSVEVGAANDPPVANAGADQTVATGQLVTLSGSGSDPDGDTLTFSWTIVSAPPGSAAALTDPLTATPSITPDRVGLYRFELTVSDGTASSSDQVDITVQGVITLTPDPLDLQTNAVGSLTVTLSAPAGPGGQSVDLHSTNQAIAAVPSAVLVLTGATSATFDVTTGTLGGTVQVTASATSFASDSATVNVGERALTLSIQDELVGVGRTTNATVTLSSPAPAGGVVVTLVIANTQKATIAPATVTIPAGETQGTAVITGVAVGTTTLTASAPGYTNAVANVNVTDALISIGFIPEIGPDEVEGVPISLTKPAPPGGLTISLVTAQPGIATVSATSTVPAGQFLPPTNPQVTGHTLGTTEITATAPGFAPDHRTVTVGLHLSFTPTSLTLGAATSRDITLHLSATAPIGGLNVQLNMDDPTIASVASPVNIPQGQTSLVVPITGIKSGTTTLRTTSPGIAQASATIIVGAPITIPVRTVGKDLQDTFQATLAVPAPAGNALVTFTSDDPTRLVISAVGTTAGGASATVTVTAGQSTTPTVFLQALADSGTVKVTASAIGYADGTANITLGKSGFYIFAPGIVSTFTTTTFAPNTQIFARSSRLNANLSVSTDQEVRGGLTVGFDIVSSLPSVGTITAPISFVGGTSFQKSTTFDPASSGTTILSFATPFPFSTPTTFQTITANVDAPNVVLPGSPLSVGRDLQVQGAVQLQNAPPSPVDVTVRVAPGGEGTVAISKTANAAGSSSVTFTGVTSTVAGNIFIQGLAQGTAQLIGSADNYDSGNLTVNVTPSGFYIFAPGIVPSFSTTTFAANTTISLRSSRLTSGLVLAGDQEVRGGISVNVDVTSSQPSVGVITTSPVAFPGGGGFQHTTAFDPISSGTSTLTYTAPAPFSIATTFQAVTATVDAPDVRINSGAAISVGRDLQQSFPVTLESAPPTGTSVDVTVTVVPGGEGFTSISKVGTTVGTNTVTFTGVTTVNVGNIFVQGFAIGSAQLRGTAMNYNTGTTNVSVTPSGFSLFAPGIVGSFTTNTFAANTTITVRTSRLNANFSFATDQELRAGLSVNVPVTSSQPSFGTITSSPVVFGGGNGSQHTTQFDPQTVGTTILSIPSPVPGFSVPSNSFQTVTANVRAPEVRFAGLNVSSQRIGRDLQLAVQISLENAPPQPVDVTLTVVPGGEGITSITKVQTTVGTNTLTFTGVTTVTVGTIWIQGRSLGSTAITAVAAGYNDGTANVSVEPAGFYIFVGGGSTSFTTTAGAGNTSLTVRSAALDPVTLNLRQDQEVRGGMSVSVTVTSSNPSVGTITVSPLVFAGGQFNKQTAFDPATAGVSVISIPSPVPGFVVISNQSTTVTANVNP